MSYTTSVILHSTYMRLTLSLTAALLLVGAGCSANTNLETTADTGANNAAGTVETGSNVQVGADDQPVTGEAVSGDTVTVSTSVAVPAVTIGAGVKATTTAKVCTMDAKQCPDGSFVGRTGPNCEFTACPAPKTEETKPAEKPAEQPAPTGPKTYTMAEVSAKAAAGQCWTVIRAKVYDLSSWIGKHPGGSAAIQSLCGIDGTAKFTAMHGGSAKQETMLATFLVGSLK